MPIKNKSLVFQQTLIPFITCTDFLVSGEKFPVKKCSSCGLKITTPVEEEEKMDRYYQSEDYIAHSDSSKGLVHLLYHRVRKYMLHQKRGLIEKEAGKKNGKILDVGAGTGYFLHEMNRQDWEVDGTEKSPEARKFAKEAFNLSLRDPEELFQLPGQSRDIITLWHVLEHIHQLDKNMKAFSRILKAGGKLIIAVPNPGSCDASHYQEYWAAYDVPRHIWHFSPDQMKTLGEKYHFRLTRMCPMPFDAFYISLLSEKYKKQKGALFFGMLHGIICTLTTLFNKKRASSLIYIFEK